MFERARVERVCKNSLKESVLDYMIYMNALNEWFKTKNHFFTKEKEKKKNNDRPFFKKGLTKRTDRAP